MDGRGYTVPFTAVSITAAQDLFYLKPAADKPICLHAIYLEQCGGTADAGDAQEEMLRVELIRLPSTVTVGSGGAAVTPVPILTNDAAAGFTARCNDTTVATTSGTAQTKWSGGWNERVPYPLVWLQENRPRIANAEAFVFRLNTAPADAVLISGTAVVFELI